MKLTRCKTAVQFRADFELETPLLLRSGRTGIYTDSIIERTPDGRLHINGYVWASLFRRALDRIAGAEEMVEYFGGYPESDMRIAETRKGVSPFWCESSLVEMGGGGEDADLFPADIRPGNRLDRKCGTAVAGALFSDEVVPPGLRIPMRFNYFCDDPAAAEAFLGSALRVVAQGIETIGGGWTYGFGRLKPVDVRARHLDLSRAEDRKRLWNATASGDRKDSGWKTVEMKQPDIRKPWTAIRVEAGLADGQLMAVTTTLPPFEPDATPEGIIPDTYVFRRNRFNENGGSASEIVIPGKAIRQAILSVPLERKYRSRNPEDAVCDGVPPGKNEPACSCFRCRCFGSVKKRGMVSVTDAVVKEPNDTVYLNRIQLCEHSLQNMNLFTGEFLSRGSFRFEILIDRAREDERFSEEVIGEIRGLLEEMKPKSDAPPGWYRLGGTSTCTGQVAVESTVEEHFTGKGERSAEDGR